MKKIVLIAVVLATGFISQAQVKFGVKGNANSYKFTGSDGGDLESQKMKIGFNAGGLVNIPISDLFAFQAELLFSNQGTKQAEGDDKITWNLNYINIPLMLQYVNPSGFFAETGPEFGLLASAKAKYDIGGMKETEDLKDQFKSFNFSWGIGAGYKLKSGFGIGARYNMGLINIIDEDDVDVKNSGFQVGVFYIFGGK